MRFHETVSVYPVACIRFHLAVPPDRGEGFHSGSEGSRTHVHLGTRRGHLCRVVRHRQGRCPRHSDDDRLGPGEVPPMIIESEV